MRQEIEIMVRILHSRADDVADAMLEKIHEVTDTIHDFDVKEEIVVTRSDVFANVGNWRYPQPE